METRQREILRYLGYGRKDADEKVNQLIAQAVEQLQQVIAPKHIYQCYPVVGIDQDSVALSCFSMKSSKLARHLSGCHEVILFAATLGVQVDQLIKRYESVEMSRAVVMQAAATALIEEYCDQVCSQISAEQQQRGNFVKMRFSPGYGDFPLEYQRMLTGVLETAKRVGIVLTDTLIMSPSKSVTAVIGVTKECANPGKKGCSTCDKTDCSYRRVLDEHIR